jgi:hypothetical protein
MIWRLVMIGSVLAWTALAFLSAIDIDTTAKVFAAIEAPVGWAMQYV